MTPEQLLQYAEQGAKLRLQAIHQELTELAAHFPRLMATFPDPAFREPVRQTVAVSHTARPDSPPPVTPPVTATATPNGRVTVHHTQTRAWKAKASRQQKAIWRKRKAAERAAAK